LITTFLTFAISIFTAWHFKAQWKFWAFVATFVLAFMPVKYSIVALVDGHFFTDTLYVFGSGFKNMTSPEGSWHVVFPSVVLLISIVVAIAGTSFYKGRKMNVRG
jgi:hypothetical protein